jgi:flagellar motor switch protein FliN/FliY
MDQNSVDDLLAQIQSNTDAIKDTAQEAVDSAAASINEIAGEMEAPLVKGGSPAASPLMPTETVAYPGSDIPMQPRRPMADVGRLLAIEVPVIVQLGMRRLTVSEVMRLAVGAIIEFGKSAEEELDLLVNNKPVGKGHAVKVGENFGIKISTIGSVKETIRKLGI